MRNLAVFAVVAAGAVYYYAWHARGTPQDCDGLWFARHPDAGFAYLVDRPNYDSASMTAWIFRHGLLGEVLSDPPPPRSCS
jgi:hypothetical protein